jgi:uncharacterized protein involved in type VI secretion and phage assembly
VRAGGKRTATADTRLYGIYYAVVTQNQDPDKMARVKVRLPWLDKGDEDQTHWALVSAPMVGDQFGWYTLPDVEDVVAVMFIAGDITRPVVLGGVWSKTDTPPEKNEGDNDFRGYRSRTGCRIVLDDSSSGKVYIADKTDANAVVVGSFQSGGSGNQSRGGATAPGCNGPQQEGVSISSMEGKMEITAKGKITATAKNVEIVTEQNTEISAGGNLELKGKVGNCNGSSAVKIEGSSTKVS